MNRSTLANTLESLETELKDIDAQILLRQRRQEFLRTAVEGIRGLLGLEASEPPEGAVPLISAAEYKEASDSATLSDTAKVERPPRAIPTTRQAVRTILAESGRPMSLSQIEREMRARGWIDLNLTKPSAAVYQAARRLVESDEPVERVPGAVPQEYRFLHDKLPPSDGRLGDLLTQEAPIT